MEIPERKGDIDVARRQKVFIRHIEDIHPGDWIKRSYPTGAEEIFEFTTQVDREANSAVCIIRNSKLVSGSTIRSRIGTRIEFTIDAFDRQEPIAVWRNVCQK